MGDENIWLLNCSVNVFYSSCVCKLLTSVCDYWSQESVMITVDVS